MHVFVWIKDELSNNKKSSIFHIKLHQYTKSQLERKININKRFSCKKKR